MRVKVLQWNVWFKENIEQVVRELKRFDADVICLQELTQGYVEQTRENTWEYIGHELGYTYRVQEIPIVTAEAQWLQGNAIFSRHPVVGQMKTWLHKPADQEDTTDQYRGYLEVRIQIGDQQLTVATTHMSFAQMNREDQELARLLSIIQSQSHPFVLTGDLNATPGSKRVVELAKHLQHAGPDFTQNTWTTKPYVFPSGPVSTLDWRYDYIFTSSDVMVQDARILETDISDHLPVQATIEMP
jgi:endonuclease/exonuclease/phosphatase family metal-dependent hydrolase